MSRPATLAGRCFLSRSPTLRPWICPSASYVEGFWSPSLSTCLEISTLKHTQIFQRYFYAGAEESFSLRRGLNSI
jgi:hypothetical protein